MKTCKVVIVRHGERADAVPTHSWNLSRIKENRRYDTPLTTRGISQAIQAGQKLSQLELPFRVIYSSPLQRCLQTAAGLAQELNLPVVVIVNLGKPCSYFRRSAAMGRKPNYADRSEAEEILKAIYPSIRLDDFIEDDGKSFQYTLASLSRKELERCEGTDEPAILIAGHCEAQRDMARISGEFGKVSTPYCGIAGFRTSFSDEDVEKTSWVMIKKPTEPDRNLLDSTTAETLSK